MEDPATLNERWPVAKSNIFAIGSKDDWPVDRATLINCQR